MNSTEREIYDKYAYKKTHIYLVYEEFERRVNSTDNEYEGLKKGECSFNYSAWERRLGISKKLLQNSIKQLVDDNVIIQTFKGGKGRGSSKYFLIRFDIENMDNKKDNKMDNNSDNYKDSNSNGSNVTVDNKMDNNLDNKMDNTSIYNNTNIISNNIYSSKDVEEMWRLYPLKQGKANAIKKIPKLLKQYGKEQIIRCIDRYIQYVDNQRKTGFPELKYKNGSTFFNTGYVDYLDCNYQEDIIAKPKEEPRRRQTNLDDL